MESARTVYPTSRHIALYGNTSFVPMDGVNNTGLNGSSENGSDFLLSAEHPTYLKVTLILLYAVIIVLAIGGNILVCYVVIAYQRMRTVTNYFIVNLAIGDILMAVFCIPMTFVANILLQYWPFGPFLCPVVLYIQIVSVFLSSFTLVAISLDRFRAIIFPLSQRLSTKQAIFIICVIWFMCLAVALPTPVMSHLDEFSRCYEDWYKRSMEFHYTLCIMILQYFLPLFVLTFTYLCIGIVTWVKKPPGEAEDGRDQRMAASKRKMIKMMITVVSLYAICWLPLHAITLASDLHPDIFYYEHYSKIWIASHWLAMSNSCVNPIVYCWMNTKFKNGYKYALRMCLCLKADTHIVEERSRIMLHAGAHQPYYRGRTSSNLSTCRGAATSTCNISPPRNNTASFSHVSNRHPHKCSLKVYLTRSPSAERHTGRPWNNASAH
ncbi:RYamide receptor [Lingula anatina]|uniref:RYamide receptor n=1 Tax=Lingula anatina TaxID=7574 RepID=A0A1S3IX78_LINAN|nr:RYamide receptor [Lingula anatina]|eukprot:XP_013402807.1 RYamide receptor [Lingula anatina]